MTKVNEQEFQQEIIATKVINDKKEYFTEIHTHANLPGDVVEFGVYNGESLRIIIELFSGDNIFGFDSFEGLPEEWATSEDYTVPKNFFNLSGNFPSLDQATLVKGWFSESIPEYKENLNQLKFIHIDSDLYSSAKTIFEELNEHIEKGTVIAFDEFIQFPEAPSKWFSNWRDGEYKACIEWMEKYNRKLKPICRTIQEQCCFLVE